VLGGSDACIAVYAGDWAVALVTFDAEVDVLGPMGWRATPLEQLHREPGATPHIETTLARDELILQIRVPATPLAGPRPITRSETGSHTLLRSPLRRWAFRSMATWSVLHGSG
jgi:CO/xanthine dehydrogenase FAD-binding subunit